MRRNPHKKLTPMRSLDLLRTVNDSSYNDMYKLRCVRDYLYEHLRNAVWKRRK